jgi:hypothetical protein
MTTDRVIECDRCQHTEKGIDPHDAEWWHILRWEVDPQGREVEVFHLCDRCRTTIDAYLGVL